MKRGFFITFEGGEGAGKSIQVEILTSHLNEEGYHLVVTREPGGTRIGEQIRSITHDPENVDLNPLAEAYLMSAARAQHVTEIIKPAIDSGKIVVCDRFVDSSIAYQGCGRKLGSDVIKKLNELAVDGAIPDLTLFLSVSPEIGMRRRGKTKKKDRLDLQQQDFYKRVHDGYISIAKENSKRYVLIDASKSIETVATKIWEVVKQRLNSIPGINRT